MAERLQGFGMKMGLINRIVGAWAGNEGGLDREVKEILEENPGISKEELFRTLLAGKGKGKSHSSENADSEKRKDNRTRHPRNYRKRW